MDDTTPMPMPCRKTFDELRKKMSPESRARAEARTKQILAQMGECPHDWQPQCTAGWTCSVCGEWSGTDPRSKS